MPGGKRASDGGCGRVRGGGGAGFVYRGAGGIDYREGLGGGLRETDRGGLAFGSLGGGSPGGNGLGGGVCECAARSGIWGCLPAEWDEPGTAGGRDGDRPREICGNSSGICRRGTYFVGVDGCGMCYLRGSVESAGDTRRKCGARFKRA